MVRAGWGSSQPDLKQSIFIVNESIANENPSPPASPNGPVPSLGARASPAPGSVPNGKPTSPYPERQQSPITPGGGQIPQTVSSKDPRQAAQQAAEIKNIVRRKLTGYVGFANLPNQWHRKSVRKGFNFNVMVVGKFWSLSALTIRVHGVRGIRSWKIYTRQHAVQHLPLPTKRAERAKLRYFA